MALESGKKAVQTKKISEKKIVSKTAPKKIPIKGKITKKPEKKVTKSVKPKSAQLPVVHETVTKNTRIKISDNTKKPEKVVVEKKPVKAIIPRNTMQVAVLSPFRFPLPTETFVANFARTVGIFFVVIGAFFSLLNLNAATGIISFSGVSNLAQTYTTSTTDGSQTSVTTSSIDTTPDVHITIDAIAPLTNIVPININVFSAQEIKLLAEEMHTGNIIKLGPAILVDNTNWKYYWDTKLFTNGEYTLRAYIKNQYGTYEYIDAAPYSILNEIFTTGTIGTTVATTSTTTTSQDQSTTSTSTIPVTQNTVSLSINENSPIHGGVSLTMHAHNPSEVKVYARNSLSYTLYYVGLATLKDGDEWTLEWNSQSVPDGTYQLSAKATFEGAFVKSPALTVTVDNVDEAVSGDTSTTSTKVDSPLAQTIPQAPTVSLQLSKSSPLNNLVDVYIESSGVQWVELYAVPKSSFSPFFIGLAQKLSDTKWKYTWQTTQSPNGDYDIYARVKTEYGFVDGSRKSISIHNEVMSSFTSQQEAAIDTLSDANTTLVKTTDGTDTTESGETKQDIVYVEPVRTFIERVSVDDGVKAEIESLLHEFKNSLNKKINELAIAIRKGDTTELQKVKDDIEDLKKDVLQKLPPSIEKKKIIDDINSYISQVAFELEELTQKNETILRERVGTAITFDSDKDGISDYDEVNLYKTNPFAADTDGDSYIDGTEIRLGYNPNDSKSESLVQYESPKESGVVREDLLAVDSITTMSDTTSGDEVSGDVSAPKKAFISGKGLPNSFVTLYIYSTPIVVTVKTDEQGSWSYVFDKELENGDHEVYVGITDNTGRVVAKSNPLAFVKTAEAYTKADSVGAAIAAEETQPSLLESNMMLLIASISVAALGLVLILLGLHVGRRELIEPVIKNA